jgi:hypothetical protein
MKQGYEVDPRRLGVVAEWGGFDPLDPRGAVALEGLLGALRGSGTVGRNMANTMTQQADAWRAIDDQMHNRDTSGQYDRGEIR